MDVNTMEEKEHKKLDLEFRQILRMIKPYIPCIVNNEYMLSYRLWLEKLNETESCEKIERNKYLFELCRQIQDGILEKPFDKQPSAGPLVPFQVYEEVNSSRGSVNCEKREEKKFAGDANVPPERKDLESKQTFSEHIEGNRARDPTNTFLTACQELKTLEKELEVTREQERSFGKQQPQKLSKNRSIFSKNDSLKYRREQDTSWYDLSELSTSTLDGSQFESRPSDLMSSSCNSPVHSNNIYETKIREMTNFIAMLQKQNLQLNENVVKYEQELSSRSKAAETDMCNLSNEVEYLKGRIKELTNIKTTLKKNQMAVSSQLHLTITDFQKRIQFAENQNYHLKTEILNFEKRLDDLKVQKCQEINDLKEQLLLMQSGEVEMLKQSHYNKLTSIENHFNGVLIEKEKEFLSQISCLKNSHDVKLAEISREYEVIVSNRNEEIRRLEKMIENQCKKMRKEVKELKNEMNGTVWADNENGDEKADLLKQCATKLEHLFKKSDKQCSKQLNKLKQEISSRDQSFQVHLDSQKAKLVGNKKHKETDDLLSQLEERYKKLLENQQSYFVAERERDAKVIRDLQEIIGKTYCDCCPSN